MPNLLANLPHLIMAAIIIGAVTALAAAGVIPGSTALAVIAAAGGVSLGVGAAAVPTTITAAPISAPPHTNVTTATTPSAPATTAA